MRIPRIASLAFLVLLLLSTIAAAMPERPTTDIYVQDNAGLLSADTKNRILTIGRELNEKTTAQIVVVTVKNLDDEPIADYANTLFRNWGIGDKGKNNGVLLLISQEPRKLRIEVGYGLEGAIPDGYTGRIRDEDLTPNLKNNDYDTGVTLAYEKLAAKTAAEYDQTLDSLADRSAQEDPAKDDTTDEDMVWLIIGIFIIFLIIVIGIIIYLLFFSHDSGSGGDGGNGWYDDRSGFGSNDSSDSFGGGDSGGGGSDGDY